MSKINKIKRFFGWCPQPPNNAPSKIRLTSKAPKMGIKKISIVIIGIIILCASMLFFVNYLMIQFGNKNTDDILVTVVYDIGDEIPEYPTPGLNITFPSWSITEQYGEPDSLYTADNGSFLVIVNFTIKNISNQTLQLNSYEESQTLKSKGLPELMIHKSGPTESIENISWLDKILEFYPNAENSLADNQTVNGTIIYQIPDGKQPLGLILKATAPGIRGLHLTFLEE